MFESRQLDKMICLNLDWNQCCIDDGSNEIFRNRIYFEIGHTKQNFENIVMSLIDLDFLIVYFNLKHHLKT